ncbi:DUF6056 family protein [Streptomyces sp. BE147]|uniref:DUF6056 family protein n=1 Tax=Streptomyces sp. BE147 TaxID=3002524 RepID=UPI002E773AF7|nr:DUF6056 family protein [Streptomyces sp. BE147]MEE1742457.1 DUF6056 family protein [Streptomyces sp. BE147]
MERVSERTVRERRVSGTRDAATPERQGEATPEKGVRDSGTPAGDFRAGGAPGQGAVRRWTPLWVKALALLPLCLLAAAARSGRWVRPSGDDWCFLPLVQDGGLSAITHKFWFLENGRVVNAVLVWAYARFGVTGHQWFGLISGLLVLGLLWAFTAAVLRRAAAGLPRGVPFLVASMVAALFLFGTDNTYKTFYWPAASVSHTLPPVFACAAAIPALRATSRRARGFALLTVLAGGLFLGTLSEETCVVAVAVLGGLLLISGRVVPRVRRRFVRMWCSAGIAGMLIAGLLLFTSPGARHRREVHGADAMLDPESLLASLDGFGRIAVTCLTAWQYLGAVAVGLVLGLLARFPYGPFPMRNELLCAGAGFCALVVSGYLCTVITYPAFGASVATSNRLWNDYLLLYILLLVHAGTLLARGWRRLVRRAGAPLAAGATVYAVVCLSLLASLGTLDSEMSARARKWDDQDTWLRSRSAAGEQVLPYRRTPISRMTEPFSRNMVWPASCVADYYGLERVTPAGQQGR